MKNIHDSSITFDQENESIKSYINCHRNITQFDFWIVKIELNFSIWRVLNLKSNDWISWQSFAILKYTPIQWLWFCRLFGANKCIRALLNARKSNAMNHHAFSFNALIASNFGTVTFIIASTNKLRPFHSATPPEWDIFEDELWLAFGNLNDSPILLAYFTWRQMNVWINQLTWEPHTLICAKKIVPAHDFAVNWYRMV